MWLRAREIGERMLDVDQAVLETGEARAAETLFEGLQQAAQPALVQADDDDGHGHRQHHGRATQQMLDGRG